MHISAFPAYSNSNRHISDRTSSSTVLVIGAGAAGLSAGYLLKQKGIDFKILEASPGYGGRIKKTDDFADFPIPLGAEWLTVSTSIFQIEPHPITSITSFRIGRKNPTYKGLTSMTMKTGRR